MKGHPSERRALEVFCLPLLSLSLFGVTVLGCSEATVVDRPNIVLIVGDDHGYTDSGFMGSAIATTPNLDRLANEGTVFTKAYNTSSVGRPSLLTMLTGLEPYQIELWMSQHQDDESGSSLGSAIRGLLTGHRRGEPARSQGPTRGSVLRELDTLPSLLARRGYRSFQAGKHWSATARWAGFTAGPGNGDQHPRDAVGLEPVWDFVGADPQEPFLLWFAPRRAHDLDNGAPAQRERYAGRELAGSALAYYADLSWLDDAVGALIAGLDERGILERTLVVYLSANGWDNAPDVHYTEGRGLAIGGERGKASMRELGFRTPMIFRLPGRVPAGRTRDDLVSTVDLFPTLLGYAGLVAPPGREGVDLRGAIERGDPLPARTLYGHLGTALTASVAANVASWRNLQRPAFFARDERWHYIDFPNVDGPFGPERELFDVQADPREEQDVAGAHADVVAELAGEIDAWRLRMSATLPNPNGRAGEWSDPND